MIPSRRRDAPLFGGLWKRRLPRGWWLAALGLPALAAVVIASPRRRDEPPPPMPERDVPAVVEARQWRRLVTAQKRRPRRNEPWHKQSRSMDETRGDGYPPPWPEPTVNPRVEHVTRHESFMILFRDEMGGIYETYVDSTRFVSLREGQAVLLHVDAYGDPAGFREVTPEAATP